MFYYSIIPGIKLYQVIHPASLVSQTGHSSVSMVTIHYSCSVQKCPQCDNWWSVYCFII